MVLTRPARGADAAGQAAGGFRSATVITDDGISLNCRDYPATEGRPEHTVVLLHGFCLSQHSWDLHVQMLRRDWSRRARVITMDHRGHGDSQRAPMGSYTIDRLAADLAQVLDTLTVRGPVTLAGHSMGALVLLRYLARPAAERPVEPRGLVLVSTAGGALTRHGVGRVLGLPTLDALTTLAAHVPGRYAPSTVCALLRPAGTVVSRRAGLRRAERDALLGTALRALTHDDLGAAVGFLASLRDFDQRHTLAEITAQTVVISGEHDALTPPLFGAELAAGIPGATHVVLRAVGHMPLLDAPHAVAAALNRTIGHCLYDAAPLREA